MARILVAYSSVDGHTQAICERLRDWLQRDGHAVTLASLAGPAPDPAGFDTVVVGASIRYGKHRPEVRAFVVRHRRWLQEHPSAFFSVNMVARKPGKDTPDGNPYVREFLNDTAWRPPLEGVFAGKIDYRRYGVLDRNVVRLIMLMTGGPTAPDACVEFTDWGAVEDFARRVAAL